MGFDFIMRQQPTRSIAGYTPQDPEAPRGFQMTNIGMGEIHYCMAKAGILDLECPLPRFSWPPDGIARQRAEELCAWLNNLSEPKVVPLPEERLRYEVIRKAIEYAQRSRSPLPNLVPSYKFCSNDGWLVVPEECVIISSGLRTALARLGPDILPSCFKHMSTAEVLEWVLSWATYNEVASRHGGYQVL